jgi:hypothetical protein
MNELAPELFEVYLPIQLAKLVGLDPRTIAKYKRLKLKLPKRAPAKPSKMISI